MFIVEIYVFYLNRHSLITKMHADRVSSPLGHLRQQKTFIPIFFWFFLESYSSSKFASSTMGFFNFNCAAVLIQLIALACVGVSLAVPHWLYVCNSFNYYNCLEFSDLVQNPPGLNQYPYPRTWGLLMVRGRVNRTHWQTWNIACQAAAQMSHGLACLSPLCHFYSGKCGGYHIIFIVSCVVSDFSSTHTTSK